MHHPGEFPLVSELGFAVAPGSHTLVAIKRTVTNSMEPPFGECNKTETVPMANCIIDCRTQYVASQCGCRDIYMNTQIGGKSCTMTEKQLVSSLREPF